MNNDIVIVRGGGDLATGIIQKLHRAGFRVLVLEVEQPTSIRRKVSLSEAVYDGEAAVEDIKATRIYSVGDIERCWEKNIVPVAVDPSGEYIRLLKPRILVDAIIAKTNLGTSRNMADITIGVGPGFIAGKDVDIVVETVRGHNLGKLIFQGEAQKNTGIPGVIMGHSIGRVIHSPCEGIITNIRYIGDTVSSQEPLAIINNTIVKATMDGLLRGIIRDGIYVKKGLKIADIDPRLEEKDNCSTISDKARSIGGAVLEAVLYLKNTNLRGYDK